MHLTKKIISACCLLLTSPLIFADGLSDLKHALAKLDGKQALTATLLTTTSRQQGEGKDKVVKEGLAQITLYDGQQGLQVTYGSEVMSKLEQESRQRINNEDADTPTLNAIGRNGATDLQTIMSSAARILRRIEQAQFIEEQAIDFRGKSQRQLSFSLPMNALITDKRTREYVKKFEGNYHIIIDENGIPLETRLDFYGKGRAYIVLSVKAYGESIVKYQVVGQRLVAMSSESSSSFDSTFGYSENKERNELALLTTTNQQYASTIQP